MTLLNKKPIKGKCKNFMTGKMSKVDIWYVLSGSGHLHCIVDYKYKMGLGGACILKDENDDKTIAEGYFMDVETVKTFKRELQKNKRAL